MGSPSSNRLPDPPDVYDPKYMNKLVSALERILVELQTPGHVAGTTANFSRLPTSATGLRSGDLWNDAGTIKIVP